MAVPPLKAHQIDYSRFIPFHPNANGDNGRKVFIDPKLAIRFLELIDIGYESERQIAGAIVNKLKAVAGGMTSDSNLNNASQHRDYFVQQNVIVTYTILQASTTHKSGGVFITDLEQAVKSEAQEPAGFYSVNFSSSEINDWVADACNPQPLPTVLGAVGAVQPNAKSEVSLDRTANSFGGYLRKMDGQRLGNQYSLFYTPSYVIDNYGRWIGGTQKRGKESGSPEALADIFLKTENSFWAETKNRYCWYVFGNGAKHVVSALKKYRAQQQHPLGRHHEFVFVAPKAPIGELKAALHSVGVELTNDMLKLDDADMPAKLHALVDPTNSYSALHRDANSESKFNKTQAAVNKALQMSPDTSFVDIVEGLHSAVTGGWA